jgi:hypothetical protein
MASAIARPRRFVSKSPAPERERRVLDRQVLAVEPRAVHQHAQTRGDLDRLGPQHVEPDRAQAPRRGPGPGGERGRRAGIAHPGQDLEAAARELERDGPADPAARPGDERHASRLHRPSVPAV